MPAADIEQAQQELVTAAQHAVEAGVDGVELHGANGYPLEQFLHPHTQRGDDAYGGSDEKRNRFIIETAQARARAIGAERTGIRLSPYNTFNDLAPREDAMQLARERDASQLDSAG